MTIGNDPGRVLRVAGAQMGPISRHDPRKRTVERLITLLDRAADEGAELVVFPELALTMFFPRWLFSYERELDAFFERTMPNRDVQPLFDRAAERRVGFCLGYAELTPEGRRFNGAILAAPEGTIIGHYRKVHLPGFVEPRPHLEWQQLEKRYFTYGDLGFPAFRASPSLKGAILGMLICNDRRWTEAWRVLGLQGVELVCVGYNTAGYGPYGGENEDSALRTFHSELLAQANSYMNATWSVSVAAKAGVEDGAQLIGGSCIVDPAGRIGARANTLDDEVFLADCDLEAGWHAKQNTFDFAAHRRAMHYGPITSQTGVREPD